MEFVPEVAKNEPVDRMEPNYDVIVDITDGRTPDATLTLSPNPQFYPPFLEVSRHTPQAPDEVHDSYDPSTFTTFARQRQPTVQRPSNSSGHQLRPSSAASQRPLRRIPRQAEVRQSPHRRAVSLRAPVPHRHQPARTTPVSVQRAAASGIADLRPALSEAETDDNGSTIDDPYQLLHTSYWPQRNTGVSSRTASAILFALEEAIRGPLQLSTDWDEVNASMSDMVGVAGPAGPVNNSRGQNGGSRVPQNPISGTSQPPSGMRTPTDIMRQRRDREARRKAESEAREREQEELERQQLEEKQAEAEAEAQKYAQAQAQQYAAGVAAENASQSRIRAPRPARGPEGQSQTVPVASGAVPGYRPAPDNTPSTRPSEYQTAPPTVGTGQANQARPPQTTAQQPQHGRSQSAAEIGGQPKPSGFSKSAQALPAGQGAPQALQQPKRVGFPHAFERWETLSSHWEGLTSYWMRKLEQNNEDLERDPISQQLARQITDLSAAGANLFHAVVELQRLRASSERKFQRWFFDTRAEQERSKEVQADLERQLKEERQGRADAFSTAQQSEKDKVKAEELLKEMRRELQISKEEARRAWEELGRREQEERDRTNSLRNGEPTLVGGVQVVPMVSGLPSRHNTTRPQTREGPYPGQTATTVGTDAYGKPAGSAGQYYEDGTPMSPVGSDPFIEPKKVDPPTSKVPYPRPLYAHDNTTVPYPATSEPDARSYVGSSEAGDEEYAPYPHDPHGDSLSYPPGPPSEESEEYEHSLLDEHYIPESAYTSAPSSVPPPAPASAADYSGAGWGPGTGWESVTPRHRHPTRLSDVLEEDEHSRTTPSRASLASRSQAGRSQASRSIL
ncbi:hypothetical protein DTO013E5_1932 [Penicillium roqueforti]|nr:hypothetical protein CBS147372_6997 [Penicillium roqueforti]KAI2716220.1 hypothetical protein CBS147354_7020 [Penicillium roqueforti]KAI2741082.1 hypothetical protein DTO012A1_4856 [Penicillium roqueforti]KAI2748772.1 hypothetical protein DTO013F2_6265 [Penicillium roqueforti]KAI2774369.1 hypothetical protein DTO012A8_1187 [Penicillium roqueforti]